MSSIMERTCARCRRVIDLNDLSINEGRPYHDHCLLQITRTRISVLADKLARRTGTVLDDEELQDLLFVEERMKKDIETQKNINLSNNDKPIFFGNTPLGKHSVMNSPEWKKILAKHGTLEGTKYHMHKAPDPPIPTTESIWEITTDENGHKGVIQVGTRPIKTVPEIDDVKKDALMPGNSVDAFVQTIQKSVDYETERIQINIWRGFVLLEKLIPDFNTLDLNARIAALNQARNKQAVSEEATA